MDTNPPKIGNYVAQCMSRITAKIVKCNVEHNHIHIVLSN